MKPEDYKRMSEDAERELMFPGAGARVDGEPGTGVYRVHVYTLENPSRPYVSMEAEDRNAAKRLAIDFMSNGIIDLDGEFIPPHRIVRIMVQEEFDEWRVQGD